MYATKQDIINKYKEAKLRIWSSKAHNGVMNEVVINDALNNASAIIDGYIAKKYNLPLATTSSLLKTYCVDVAVYELTAGEGYLTDDIESRYLKAIKFLKDVGTGVFSLGFSQKQEAKSSASKIIVTNVSPRLFKRRS